MIEINLFGFVYGLVLPELSFFFEFLVGDQWRAIIHLFFGFSLSLRILLLKFFD